MSKVNFREHRGSLQESLEMTKEFDSLYDLFNYYDPKDGNSLYLGYYGFDNRCNQELFILQDANLGGVIGFVFEEKL